MNVCYYDGVKEYTSVLFDWDGTLAKTLDVWLEALKTPLAKHGHNLTDKQIGANFEIFKRRSTGLGVHNIDVILAEAADLAKTNTKQVELYQDVVNLLTILRDRKKKIGLITTSTHEQVDFLLEKFQLGQFLEVVICGDDVKQQKPNAEPLEKALQLLGCDPASAVLVGDSGTDIKAAANAKVDSILFHPLRHGVFYDIEELKKLNPTYVVGSLQEVADIV